MLRALLLASALGLCACTHSLHVLQVSDFGPTYAAFNKGELVTSESEQFVIMGFVTQTDYVNAAYTRLMSKCEAGNIQGIQTEYFTDHGFFSWTNRIRMQGLCLKRN